MPPVVAEIVHIHEAWRAAREVSEAHLRLRHHPRVFIKAVVVDVWVAEAQAADLKLVQVVVEPPEGGLQDVMQIPERRALR